MKIGMKKGFTLIELLIVLGIIGVMFTYASINLFSAQTETYLDSNLTSLLSDIKRQQLKSMLGETFGGASTYNFGIYFETNRYTLFQGTVFSPSDPSNYSVDLEDTVQFSSINVPSSQLVFTKGGGEVVNYSAGSDTITIQDIRTSTQKTITVNQYGVITGVN